MQAITSPTDPRELPVRFSRLKHIDKSPLHYWQSCQESINKTSLALRMGIGTHAMTFKLPVLEFAGVRNGRKWEAFKIDAGDTPILNSAEYARAATMTAALLSHPIAAAMIYAPANVYEEHIEWSRAGRAKSSRVDIYNRERSIVVDYKTTRDASVRNFTRDAWRMFYPAQLQYYRDAIFARHGWMPRSACIVTQESSAPYDVVPYLIKMETLEICAITIAKWETTLAECELAQRWPGISSRIVEFEPPNFGDHIAIDEGADDVPMEGSFL